MTTTYAPETPRATPVRRRATPARRLHGRGRTVGLSLVITYLSVIVLIPLAAVLYQLFRKIAGKHVRFAPPPAAE